MDNPESPEKFSFPAFGKGLAVVAVIYALTGAWLWLSAENTIKAQQAETVSKTVAIVDADASARATGEQHETPLPIAPGLGLPSDISLLGSGLAAAPIEGLYTKTTEGMVPAIREKDGLTPFAAYRRPFDKQAADKPIISIVIVDLGLSAKATEVALGKMPPEVSFSLSPYALTPDLWVNESRARGHEIWMTLPMETADFPETDPGPHTVLIGAPEHENALKVINVLGRISGYVGVVGGPDQIFLNAVNDMRPVLSAIYGHGLGFADGMEMPGSIPATMALGMNAPYMNIDVWIDKTETAEAIRAQFDRLEQIAREQGSAAGAIRPAPLSYQETERWLATLAEKGFVLAPLSAQAGM
ncbi:MAG: divergent polysaccharide deacetylase family protein [Proteobacteria bacterium]|nr:divergent polysaccharide deacetylase family protein [Pseudomonadota bacterium]